MAINVRTKRTVIRSGVFVALLLIGALAFVSYFMHAVYENEIKIAYEEVPAAVREAFEKEFPNITDAQWEYEDDEYVGEFMIEGREAEAAYLPDGTKTETEYAIDPSDLPEKALKYLRSKKGYEIAEAERLYIAGSDVAYEVELVGRLHQWDCAFDIEGNLLSKERDGPQLEKNASGEYDD